MTNYTPIVVTIIAAVIILKAALLWKMKHLRAILRSRDWWFIMGARVSLFIFAIITFITSLRTPNLTIFSVIAMLFLFQTSLFDLIGFSIMDKYLMELLKSSKS